MSTKPSIAISIGDLNGVGVEIAFKAHKEITQFCTPVYCINKQMLQQALDLLHSTMPHDCILSEVEGDFQIQPGCIDKASGLYSYNSFMQGIKLTQTQQTDAVVTMPIHKEAWMKAGLKYKGHTDLLRKHFNKEAIMMLGCSKMFVALYTEHIPLADVASMIQKEKLVQFFLDFYNTLTPSKVAVLGLNPHAGDNGVLGNEEDEIVAALTEINTQLNKEVFVGPVVPDVAFTPHFRKNFTYFIAMYHDQGLAPLKALYFDESINVSLNLPIIRTSVDHGTAFDIAYQNKANTLSYINAVTSACNFIKAQ